jgi:acetyltransferase-like isoleucine patch superfamily enzyme
MTPHSAPRTLAWDWYPGTIPQNVVVDDAAYVETTFSFHRYRSQAEVGVSIGPGAATYLGTMFDVGPRGRVSLGRCALVHGARIICDAQVDIGDYSLISWNVVIMDTYRLSPDPRLRRDALHRTAQRSPRDLEDPFATARPVRIESNVWIGFDACILPGVRVGQGAVIGAKSVVFEDVPPYTVVAGNPAMIVRRLEQPTAEDLRAAIGEGGDDVE